RFPPIILERRHLFPELSERLGEVGFLDRLWPKPAVGRLRDLGCGDGFAHWRAGGPVEAALVCRRLCDEILPGHLSSYWNRPPPAQLTMSFPVLAGMRAWMQLIPSSPGPTVTRSSQPGRPESNSA